MATWPGPDTLPVHPNVEVIASGVATPWALAFPPDGRILVTERGGRIRVIRDGALQPAAWASLDVGALSEAGLLGIALAPDYAESRHVYVFATFVRSRTVRQPVRGLVARVIRYTDRGTMGVDPTTILDDLPSHQLHAGGALGFGPDGMLYISIGDTFEPVAAQDPGSWAGAVLRFHPDGTIPADNPTPGSPVWASGLRNVQGLAWHPETGDLLAIDHGPSGLATEGGRTDQDELNVIRPGGNYGWPVVTGLAADSRFHDPLVEWTPAMAPAGLAIHDGTGNADWRGAVLVTGLRGRELRRLSLEAVDGRWRVTSQQSLYTNEFGRLRAVAVSPAGDVYFATSNQDGRGTPVVGDDRLFRMLLDR
jgi:aldose sugar dehydrogenase